jgi:fibronectin type 3 domain-containing protein
VESAAAATREVDYRDRFPPPAPPDLVALGEGSQVRLIWQESLAADRAGYRVYRRYGDGDFEPLLGGELVTSGEHVDTGLAPGSYVYRVTAVDESGNEGEASPEVEVELEAAGGSPEGS